MTVTDVIYQRRVAAIAHAAEIDNTTEAARVFGVARKTLSEWIRLARTYGLSALVPKGRRRPQQPNEMAAWEIETILAEAIARSTLGAGRLLEYWPSGRWTGPSPVCRRCWPVTGWAPALSV